MHQNLRPYRQYWPRVHPTAYVDPHALLIGRVTLARDASIWPFAAARGDVYRIEIDARTNVQDGAVLHVTHDGPYTPGGSPLLIGDDVTVGHGAILHACKIGDLCLIGMGATVLDGAELGHAVFVGAGERMRKSQNATIGSGSQAPERCFLYDEAGMLLGEYDLQGVVKAEYLGIEGVPMAVRVPASAGVVDLYGITADHLGTPRAVFNGSGVPVWRWPLVDGEPFGHSAPQEDPDGNEKPFVFNLRFPGQYYDAESGLHYNYFRDYEPGTGRYVQSDPIGIFGGINTFAYAASQPLLLIDPTGESYAAAVGGWIAADGAVPEPTDAAWPKWAGYGLLLGGALLYDACTESAEEREERCQEEYDRDIATCRAIGRAERAGRRPRGAGARCYQSASERYGNCLAGRDNGPLDTWNN